jgi:16S rRNA C967 or C1407 C5-methylase (RsmB/RsmF family)
MNRFRKQHALAILSVLEKTKNPFDSILRNYFRQHKSLGSKDRAWISDILYHYIRWKNLYDHLQLSSFDTLPENLDKLSLPSYLRWGCPQKLFNRLVQSYGLEKGIEICKINQTRAPLTLRTNLIKISREALLEQLSVELDVKPTPLSKVGIYCFSKINFPTLSAFEQGLFEIQDEASQLGAALVNPKKKDQVLDFCAGSGGKTLAIAPQMRHSGQIYLHDIRPYALQQAKKRVKRAGIQNIQFNLPSSLHSMDWVIVDAPCSGTGTYRRNPDLKWKFDSIDFNHLLEEQRTIFDQAYAYLKPSGIIVYMTCSILPEENVLQQSYFQTKYSLRQVDHFSTLPQLDGMDGFFAVSLTANK